ncbi:MAG TPA: transglycosylase domain-containing protein, partial [Dehalococcoidia bacterium]|nr:transglycosylase domain-containing protein [Dehalococcoidia bacterium]
MRPKRGTFTRHSRRNLRFLLKSAVALAFLANIVVVVVAVAALLNYHHFSSDFVSPEALSVNQPSAGATIVDRNGNLLYRVIDEKGERVPVTLDKISPDLVAATISTEDNTFFGNAGLNVKGLARAIIENMNVFAGDSQLGEGSGGSSITQQLVKNLYIPNDQRPERSISRKLREAVFSLELTKRYDKSQILQWYLNQISYGGIYTGVQAASQAYFNKPVSDLTLAQAATLAGIPQSPAQYDPITNPDAAIARRNQVLDLMEQRSRIQVGPNSYYLPDHAAIEAAKQAPLDIAKPNYSIEAPHFVFSYIEPQLEKLVGKDAMLHDGLVVTTTLDLNLQHDAEQAVDKNIAPYEKASNDHNGAAIVMDPKTGEVLAMVGSRNYFDKDIDGEVNNLLAINSPGSSFKPFIYLSAFLKLGWNPDTILQDTPVTYQESDGTTFSPTNPEKTYNGPISLRNALGNSLNVTAFKAAEAVTVPSVIAFGKSVGITSLTGSYGPSIAIGGVDIKPFDLAYAYSALANDGVMAGQTTFAPLAPDERNIDPVGILKVTDASGNVLFDINDHRGEWRVIPHQDAAEMTDILSDPSAVCITFGCGGLNVPGHKVAVKTGTSQPFDQNGPNKDDIGETLAF